MMNMRIDGLDRIEADFITLQQISEDELWAMIAPAAELLKTKMQDVISRLFRQRSGSLRESITVTRKLQSGKDNADPGSAGRVYALVGPNDAPHPKSTQGKRKTRGPKGGGGGTFAGTNAEVGWILEYGSARIPGRHWMETACAEAEEELLALLETAWNDHLTASGF